MRKEQESNRVGFADSECPLYCRTSNFVGGADSEFPLYFYVKLCGYSQEYFGRDDETKEVILSPGFYHEFEGTLEETVYKCWTDEPEEGYFLLIKCYNNVIILL